MFTHYDLDLINALRREREADAAQQRLARSLRRTRSSRRWPFARYGTRGAAPTISHARSGSPTSLPTRITAKEVESTSAPCRRRGQPLKSTVAVAECLSVCPYSSTGRFASEIISSLTPAKETT